MDVALWCYKRTDVWMEISKWVSYIDSFLLSCCLQPAGWRLTVTVRPARMRNRGIQVIFQPGLSYPILIAHSSPSLQPWFFLWSCHLPSLYTWDAQRHNFWPREHQRRPKLTWPKTGRLAVQEGWMNVWNETVLKEKLIHMIYFRPGGVVCCLCVSEQTIYEEWSATACVCQ